MSQIITFSADKIFANDLESIIKKSGYQNTSLLKGSTFSLFAVGEVKGLSVSGCKWNLENKSMHPGTHGLHNVVTENFLEIQYTSGLLLLFLNR